MLHIIKVLFDNESFGIMLNLFIGLTTLIISLVIFVMDKGNADNRNIFKITLLNESKIKDLIILTIINYILIILQEFINNILIILYLRICIILIVIWIIIKMFRSFVKLINMISNDSKKNKFIMANFAKIIKNYSYLVLKNNKNKSQKHSIIDKKISSLSCISYSNDIFYRINDNYNSIFSKYSGRIVNINYNLLAKINKKLEKQIVDKNLSFSDTAKKNIFIFTKMVGDEIDNDALIIYLDRNFDNYDFDNIFKIKHKFILIYFIIHKINPPSFYISLFLY